jgi:tetratricopeptide (TPR) repeat protein
VFEPDKITTVRSIVLVMLVAWLVKLGESGWRGAAQSTATTRSGKVAAAGVSVVETAGPSWLGFLRVPVVIAIVVYALIYLISTIFSVTPDSSIFGSYQREQGFYSQLSYMMLGIMVLANMRSRAQVDRLVNFMLMTSLPVALYGVIQALKLDPLPWAGDTSTRVASSMGNAIFVAAWLIMVVPFAIYRLALGLSGAMAARNALSVETVEVDPGRSRTSRRTRPSELPSYGWAVVANSAGIIITSLMFFYLALKMMAGLPYPDARTWWILPVALLSFGLSVGAIEWLGQRRDDPRQTGVFLPIVGTLLFFTAFLALTLTWNLDNSTGSVALNLGFDGAGLLWTFFFFLLWASISAAAYALAGRKLNLDYASQDRGVETEVEDDTAGLAAVALDFLVRLVFGSLAGREREEGYASSDRGVVRGALNIGYALLIIVQLTCIYLTQSRGPWLGLGAGFVVFMVAVWLVGRTRGVRWMTRLGGIASALVLVLALFVAVLNIPNSPLQSLGNLPILGRGIERLSTLTRTEDGTGKVRELIWEGATNLILSDPTRALIGWGPESMYVAYNRFYPPALGQVELRNATPDRSHNVEFDQMVTMGMLGLLAYFFLVATSFFFGIRLLKRAANTRDRLFAIAILAAVASHFIEIQTGIQIASTWTYFYLTTGMMVAFGYYITGYLRPAGEMALAAPAQADGNGASTQRVPADREAMPETAIAETRPVGAGLALGAGSRGGSTVVAANGKAASSGSSGSAPARRSKASQAVQQPAMRRGSGQSGSRGSQPVDGRRRQPTMQYGSQYGSSRSVRSTEGTYTNWYRSPALLILYGVALIVALFIVWTVNSASVRADTLFKQAQAYDGAQRYFTQTDTSTNTVYPGSLQFYDEAISLQPNQDYYYLFEGRAWLEASKQVDTEMCPSQTGQQQACNIRAGKYYSADPTQAASEKQAERLYRLQKSETILLAAHNLSPLNTDHYANLGRLYLYWGDPSGGNDASKNPIAVQWMKQATEHTPGNAQLWDELGVAYDRDNQFQKGIDAINHSQYDIDSAYARSPFIKGQLLQERAGTIKNYLNAGASIPTDGETDWGKLVLDAGKAYSDTVGLDMTQFMVDQAQSRIDFLLEASQPFTKTNTQLAPNILHNVLTDTLQLSLQNQITNWEGQLSSFMKEHSVSVPDSTPVPDATFQSLINNPAWADTAAQTWSDPNMQTITNNASMAHYGMGLVYQETGQTDRARSEYNRALALKPTYSEAQKALQALR